MKFRKSSSRLLKRGLLAVGLGAGIGLAQWSPNFFLSAQEAAQAPTGLRGILPAQIPAGLIEDDFVSSLGESWSDWSKGTAKLVADLYEKEGLNAAGQREVLATLKVKLGTFEKALGDAKYAPIFDKLSQQYGRLSRRVWVAQGALDTLELNPKTAQENRVKAAQANAAAAAAALDTYLGTLDNGQSWRAFAKTGEVGKLASSEVPAEVISTVQSRLTNLDKLPSEEQRKFLQRTAFVNLRAALDEYVAVANAPAPVVNQPALRESLKKLVEALEKYEDSRSIEDAKAARAAFAETRKLAADGGDVLGDALSASYFNYNTRVVASEAFLSKLVGEKQNDQGPVDDFVLGAKVDGTQWTTTTVGVDLVPSAKDIRFALTLTGISQTSTQGVTDQATIFTSGYHQFWARKPIAFDGDKFSTAPGTIDVQANNTTTGARTKISGLPIFGSIADNYAVGEATNRRGASEAIAAGKLRDKVLPRFDQEVDKKFNDYSGKVESEVNETLRKNNLFPSARSYRTTDTDLAISTRLMENGELGGDSTRLTAGSPVGATIHLHETAINNALDRLGLAGKSYTEEELANELASAVKVLTGKVIDLKKKDEKPDQTKFVFPATDPLRVRLQDGQVTLVFRLGLKPEGSEEIPTQEIAVPIAVSIDGTNVKLEAGQVTVSPVETVKNPVEQRARAAVVTTKIQKALPTRTADRFIGIKRGEGAEIQVAVTQVKANAGWLSIVFE